MSSARLHGPESQTPLAMLMTMRSGFIETAMSPAINIFLGVVGTIAANISTTAPTQEISGRPILLGTPLPR